MTHKKRITASSIREEALSRLDELIRKRPNHRCPTCHCHDSHMRR